MRRRQQRRRDPAPHRADRQRAGDIRCSLRQRHGGLGADQERRRGLRDRCDGRRRIPLVATTGRPPNLRRLADQRKIQHAGRSVAWLTRMLWEHEIPGSNPGAPTKFQEGLPVLPVLVIIAVITVVAVLALRWFERYRSTDAWRASD